MKLSLMQVVAIIFIVFSNSVWGLADTLGSVTDRYAYEAYGILLAETGQGTPNLYRYTGEQWDPDLEHYYLRARYYEPDRGRFWTMDPFEGFRRDPQSLHKYLYAHANPVMYMDPSGNFSIVETSITSMTRGQLAKYIGRVSIATGFSVVATVQRYKILYPLANRLVAISNELNSLNPELANSLRKSAQGIYAQIGMGANAGGVVTTFMVASLPSPVGPVLGLARIINIVKSGNDAVNVAVATLLSGFEVSDGTFYAGIKGRFSNPNRTVLDVIFSNVNVADDLLPAELMLHAINMRDFREAISSFIDLGNNIRKYGV
ncbi:MAG: RHS repeat-associated core domain-containing protein, partial [Kiritimatiellae bacterium]|nr:RHS repeat-associated core domain-containing protein [Kiritimatiellia bacterium]